MDIPFRLSLSAASPHGVLWNPWGSTVPNSVNNTVLANLSAELQHRYSLLAPTGECWVIGYTVVGETDDAEVSLGVYDVDRATFDELYPTVAVTTAGGGLVDRFQGSGILLPLLTAGGRVPCIKYVPVSGTVVITGHLSIHVTQSSASGGVLVAPTVFLQESASGDPLLEELTGLPLTSES